MQDIFQSMQFKGKINFGDIDANSQFHLLDRAANLTFTWNFGKRKVKVNQNNKLKAVAKTPSLSLFLNQLRHSQVAFCPGTLPARL